MKRVLGGLASLVVLIGLLVGIPAALVFFAGNPFPTGDELARVLSGPDVGGVFFVGTVLPLIGWLAWLSMAIAILVEIPAQIRPCLPTSRPTPRRSPAMCRSPRTTESRCQTARNRQLFESDVSNASRIGGAPSNTSACGLNRNTNVWADWRRKGSIADNCAHLLRRPNRMG